VPRPGDSEVTMESSCYLLQLPVEPLKGRGNPVKYLAQGPRQGHNKRTWRLIFTLSLWCWTSSRKAVNTNFSKFFRLTRRGDRTQVYRLRRGRSNHQSTRIDWLHPYFEQEQNKNWRGTYVALSTVVTLKTTPFNQSIMNRRCENGQHPMHSRSLPAWKKKRLYLRILIKFRTIL